VSAVQEHHLNRARWHGDALIQLRALNRPSERVARLELVAQLKSEGFTKSGTRSADLAASVARSSKLAMAAKVGGGGLAVIGGAVSFAEYRQEGDSTSEAQ